MLIERSGCCLQSTKPEPGLQSTNAGEVQILELYSIRTLRGQRGRKIFEEYSDFLYSNSSTDMEAFGFSFFFLFLFFFFCVQVD